MKLEVRTFGTPYSLSLSTVSSSILPFINGPMGTSANFSHFSLTEQSNVKSFDSTGHTFLAFANYRNETSVQGHNIHSFME